jgi:hypothetical protein
MNDRLRHEWSRPGLEGRRACPVSTSRSVGKAFSDDSFDRQISAGAIIDPQLGAVAVAEIELGEVTFQVCFADMLVDAIDAALQDREVALDGVGISLSPDIFFGGVVNRLIVRECGADRRVDVRFIGHEPAVFMGMLGDDRVEVCGGHVRDVEATDAAATLDQGHDGLFVGDRGVGAVSGFPADVGFIGHRYTCHDHPPGVDSQGES